MSRTNTLASRILYEDNHYIALNKLCGELVQGDETGDEPLVDAVRSYIRIREQKPGEAFVQVAHRIDRPVSGVVLFAKTSKGLARINDLFRQQAVDAVLQGKRLFLKQQLNLLGKAAVGNLALSEAERKERIENFLWIECGMERTDEVICRYQELLDKVGFNSRGSDGAALRKHVE